MILKPGTVFGCQANSKVSFGIIGTGGRGTYVGGHMTRDDNAQFVAICDIYQDRIDKAKTAIPGADQARVFTCDQYHSPVPFTVHCNDQPGCNCEPAVDGM
jgi:hypothetical protein